MLQLHVNFPVRASAVSGRASPQFPFSSIQAPRCTQRVQKLAERRPVHCAAAASAEAEYDTTAEEVTSGDVQIQDLKTGVAHVYNVRGSPDKFRRVIDKIRGRSYADALFNLTKLPYRAVEEITEVLKSAANNAANNQGASKTDLIVSECFVDGAGHYKRFHPRAKGRPFKIQVKKSHLTIKVTEVSQTQRQKLVNGINKKSR